MSKGTFPTTKSATDIITQVECNYRGDLQTSDTKLDNDRHLSFMSRYLEEIGEDVICLKGQVHGEIGQSEISKWHSLA